MSDNNTPTRQFVAQPPFWGSKIASITTPAYQKNFFKAHLVTVVAVFAFTAVLGAMFIGLQSLSEGRAAWIQESAGRGFVFVLLAILFGGTWLWYRRSRDGEIHISVTSDGLTVDTRPGDVYPFEGAKLGTWGVTGGATMGTALHLQCGSRRMVIGGRDHRVSAATRLDAPDVGYGLPIDIDAWLPASDYAELLDMVGSRTGLDVRPPTSEEATRCLLFTNPLLVQEMKPKLFNFDRERRQFMASLGQPRLAIEPGAKAIRVIDPNTDAVVASASPAQVTVSPVTYRPVSRHWIPDLGNFMSDAATTHWSTSPGLVISIAGMQPLTIGCRDAGGGGLELRFSWNGNVRDENGRADYEVSGADWQLLVKTFGLTSAMEPVNS